MSQSSQRVVLLAAVALVSYGFFWADSAKDYGSLSAGSLDCSGAPRTTCDDMILSKLEGSASALEMTCKSESVDSLAVPGQRIFLGLGQPLSGLVKESSDRSVRLASLKNTFGEEFATFSMANGPSWVYSGIWDKDEKSILLVDTSTKSIFHISIAGKLVRQVITSRLGAEGRFEPALLQVGSSGYVVEDGEGHLMWLDENYAVQNQIFLANTQDKDGNLAGGIWTWVDLGGEIIAFGDKGKNPNSTEGWSTAILRFKLGSPTGFETVHDLDLKSKTGLFSRLGFPILASAGGKAYILLVEGAPGIYEIGSGIRRLRAFPLGYEEFPDLGEFNRKTAPLMYKKIEQSKSVAGIYGRGDFLYILTRRPDAFGEGIIWFLSKVDPVKEEVVSTVPLPTSSANLILIPGKNYWALVEKGRVESLGNQKIDSFKLIPTGVIESSLQSVGDIKAGPLGSGSTLPKTR